MNPQCVSPNGDNGSKWGSGSSACLSSSSDPIFAAEDSVIPTLDEVRQVYARSRSHWQNLLARAKSMRMREGTVNLSTIARNTPARCSASRSCLFSSSILVSSSMTRMGTLVLTCNFGNCWVILSITGSYCISNFATSATRNMCRKKLRMANVHRARRPLRQKWPPNRHVLFESYFDFTLPSATVNQSPTKKICDRRAPSVTTSQTLYPNTTNEDHQLAHRLSDPLYPKSGFIATGETTITKKGSSAPMSEKMTQYKTE
ncbi:hypothetical protein MCOR17_009986 [Pyricularia oryzae]|nr:hypothetical protein MCOR17_009986 [Pyricularia oryzae]